jgi:hypothetical protein
LKPRFQADNDLDTAIRRGVLRREPSIDFQSAAAAKLDAVPDLAVLRSAAAQGRILVSHDVTTMPAAFSELKLTGETSPGVFLVPQATPIGAVVDSLVLIWMVSDAMEWHNRLVWLPL